MARWDEGVELSDNGENRIVFDVPADEDKFAGGGHSRSAKVLAQTVVQIAKQKADGSVGLEGEWGAGKSTVINLAKKYLDKFSAEEEYCLFTFDMWGHQTEEFRRSFLEALIEWLGDTGVVSAKFAESSLDRVRDRVRTVKSNRIRDYSLLGLVLVIFGPILPIAYIWLSPFAFSNSIDVNVIGYNPWEIVLYLMFFIYSLFSLRVFYFYYRFCSNKKNRFIANGLTGRFSFLKKAYFFVWTAISGLKWAIARSVVVFSNEVDKDTITQNIRETDPTSVEFHNILNDILSEIQSKKRRLIIVLDNVDRLPMDSIVNAWADIRSIISNSRSGQLNSYIISIVPYDRGWVTSAMGADTAASVSPIRGVFEKTFVRIIRVSPPVLSDWKGYFDRCVERANLAECGADDAFRLFKLLDLNFQLEHVHPTPRKILKYVNDISTLWGEWCGELSLDGVALYVLHREKIERDRSALLSEDLVNQRFFSVLECDNWRGELAALYFNVDLEMANQVLLNPEISRCLVKEDDGQELLRLSRIEGFQEVFVDIVSVEIYRWLQSDWQQFVTALQNIALLELEGQIGKSVWGEVLKAVRHTDKKILGSDTEVVLGLLQSMSRIPVFVVVRLFGELVSLWAFPIRKDNLESHFDAGAGWWHFFSKVQAEVEKIAGKEGRDEFLDAAQVVTDAYLVLGAAENVDGDLVRELLAKGTSKGQLVPAFTLALDKRLQKLPAMMLGGRKLFSKDKLLSCLKLLVDRLQTNQISAAQDLNSAVRVVGVIYSTLRSEHNLRHQNDELHSVLSLARKDGAWLRQGMILNKASQDAAGICIWLHIISSAKVGEQSSIQIPDNHPTFGNLSEVKAWANEVMSNGELLSDAEQERLAECIEDSHDFSTLLNLALMNGHSKSLSSVVLKELLIRAKYLRLNVGDFIKAYGTVQEIVGEDVARNSLQKFSGWYEHYEQALEEQGIKETPTELIEGIYTTEPSNRVRGLIGLIVRELKKVTSEEWLEELNVEGDYLRLLIAIGSHESIQMPAGAFRPALLEHIEGVLTGSSSPQKYSDQWRTVYSSLPPVSKKALAVDILQKLARIVPAAEGVGVFCRVYEDVLMDLPIENDPDVFFKKLFFQIVGRRSDFAEEYLVKQKASLKSALAATTAETREGLVEEMQGIFDADSDWAYQMNRLSDLRIWEPLEVEDGGAKTD